MLLNNFLGLNGVRVTSSIFLSQISEGAIRLTHVAVALFLLSQRYRQAKFVWCVNASIQFLMQQAQVFLRAAKTEE